VLCFRRSKTGTTFWPKAIPVLATSLATQLWWPTGWGYDDQRDFPGLLPRWRRRRSPLRRARSAPGGPCTARPHVRQREDRRKSTLSVLC
jgi:hypothetical protein